MYLSVALPVPVKGPDPNAIPDSLAQVTAAESASESQTSFGMGAVVPYPQRRQIMAFYPPPYHGMAGYRGLGCCSKSKGLGCPDCGGTCKGLGQTTDQISSDVTAQLDALNSNVQGILNAGSDLGLATWLLVGFAGVGLWYALNGTYSIGRTIRKTVRRSRSRRVTREALV